jgi:hypothetical protein
VASTRICSYEPCRRTVVAYDHCRTHSDRKKRYGDPGMTGRHATNCDCYECLDRPPGTKRCPCCAEFKLLSAFHHSRDDYQGFCIQCRSLTYVRYRYGLSTSSYLALLKSQNNACAICFTVDPGGPHNRWYVDHDHTCCPGGKTCGNCVRGLLCFKCNVLLGMAQDDINVLRSAIRYLKDGEV